MGRAWPIVVTAWLLLAGAIALAGVLAFWGLNRAKHRDRTSGTPPPDRTFGTRDGTWVASKGEQRIANWLSAQQLAYAYEPELAGGLTPDFHLEGTRVVIEYWGMAGQADYEDRMVEKMEIYREHGYEVVGLFPTHLHEMEDVLERELAKRGAL